MPVKRSPSGSARFDATIRPMTPGAESSRRKRCDATNAAAVDPSVLDWLLEDSDASARWLALRLLLKRPDDDPDVVATQRRIPSSPWVQALLDGQQADGSWARGKTSRPRYSATGHRLTALAELGTPGDDPRVAAGCELLLERTELPGEGFCARQSKPRVPHECGQGAMLYLFNHFGYGADKRVKAAADWLLANQMLDGGWNCAHHPKGRLQSDGVIRFDHACALDRPHHKSSLFTTMAVLKGLSSMRRPPKRPIARGVEFLLQHRVHRARDSRRAIYRWPPQLHFLGAGYDGLHPLRVLAMTGAPRDERLDEALSYLESRALHGRWPADGESGDQTGAPNKWITVHALNVLQVLRPPTVA